MPKVTETSGFDQYGKTCSVIFGNATSSQLKYIEASMQLQQTAFTSCDGIVANQLKWIENYLNKNNYSNIAIDGLLRIYANIVNEFMKLVSMSYDLTTSNIESYNKSLISLNEYFFWGDDIDEKGEYNNSNYSSSYRGSGFSLCNSDTN